MKIIKHFSVFGRCAVRVKIRKKIFNAANDFYTRLGFSDIIRRLWDKAQGLRWMK